MASRKAPSLVVAASLGAVEALKDQAGLCRWGYALRSLHRRAVISVSLSETAPPAGASSRPTTSSSAAEVRLHKAHHLVCWGPN
ncbi:uncharacterized protein LOC100827700 [Brachypodium distachyon]|uniref:Wound induced protein n=1 Tax=Brachypodium distachyon TaxID=15368 RepID=I1HXG3_BRADI|nr:uncharacterized protein LOC100827700 [Brachypodium distachyon]KQJ93436.1 hypothetical protein BRADI_3g04585v3 [Brachypodium distachyon]|eukprot:XP_010233840.1 uncharacterized protein LOC100827700 [Brachypodium distachyon]